MDHQLRSPVEESRGILPVKLLKLTSLEMRFLHSDAKSGCYIILFRGLINHPKPLLDLS